MARMALQLAHCQEQIWKPERLWANIVFVYQEQKSPNRFTILRSVIFFGYYNGLRSVVGRFFATAKRQRDKLFILIASQTRSQRVPFCTLWLSNAWPWSRFIILRDVFMHARFISCVFCFHSNYCLLVKYSKFRYSIWKCRQVIEMLERKPLWWKKLCTVLYQ